MSVYSIYRPPNSNVTSFFEDLENCLDILSRENNFFYLMGDFNIDLLSENNNRETFFHSTYSNACYPHINKPTRIVNNSATLIDNIFSNVVDKDVDSGLLYSDISDHLPIFVITHNDLLMKSHTIDRLLTEKKLLRILNRLKLI